ncbi:protein kinase [Streptomyces sp. NPDC051907]|uniref:protein kinase domain-containing protein n=1 Tax=Streptomyces sp. NPDC051907 TaxID=3155284 RepID=UPI00342982ED
MSEAEQSRKPQRDTAEEPERDSGRVSGTEPQVESQDPKKELEPDRGEREADSVVPKPRSGASQDEPDADAADAAEAADAADAAEAKAEVEPDVKAGAVSAVGSGAKSKASADAKTAAGATGASESGSGSGAEAGSAVTSDAGSEAAEAKAEVEPDVKAGASADAKTAAAGATGAEPKVEAAEGKGAAGSGSRSGAKSKAGAGSAVTSGAGSEAAEAKSPATPAAKPEVKAEAKPVTKPEAQAGAKPEARVEAKPEAAPATKPVAGAGTGDKADEGKVGAAGGGKSAAGGGGGAAEGKPGGVKSASGAAKPAAGAGGVDSADSEGRLLSGRYRLGGVLGRGGMGTVWRAVDETLGRTVAVKELRFPNSIDEDEKRRLITRTLREAKAIARIRNNSAVTVYDVVDEDDRPWIVMELVEGKSLAEAIREDGTLTSRRAAEVGLAILDVLQSAHRQGILHRDVKPSNVLIAEDGRVVLTDFGIAQVEGDPSITSTGMLVGAPSYISPERARGHKPGPAADLWSLGGLLYASVEGCPPYDKGSAIATLTAVMTEPLDPPKNAGPLLEEVIYGLLVKDPAQRLDDAGARALLTQVLLAPEEQERPAEPEPSPEATRAIALPPVPPPTPSVPKDPAADRVRGALRSVRNAAAKPEPRPQPAPQATPARPASARAPITDVVPRRTLMIIAVVVVLAVLSTVLWIALDGDGEKKGGQNKTKGDTTASAGVAANGGGDGQSTEGTGKGTSSGADAGKEEDGGKGEQASGEPGGDKPADPPKTDDPAGGKAVPDGYVMVTNDQFHFTMAMPKGFKMTGIAGQNSGGIFSESGGFPRVQVDFNASPKDDAAAAWSAAVAGTRVSSDQYKHIDIKKVDYNGYPTVADWTFERNQGGERVRVLNRGFKVDAGRGYSIMISCKASEWDGEECQTLRKTAFATFRPKD